MTARLRIATRARRYTVGATAISLIVAVAVFYAAWSGYVVRVRTNELSRQVSAIAAGVESLENASSGGGESTSGIMAKRLFQVQAGLLGVALYVTNEQGEVRQASLDSGVGRILPVSALDPADDRGNRTGVATIESGRVIVAAAPLAGDGWLVAVQPLKEVRAAQGGILALLALALILATALAMLAGWLLARRLAGPLERLRWAAEDVTGGAWGRQVEVEGDDEVASLARSFNRMSARVAAAYEAQTEFVGDVSHELRTPITAIRGWAGALADGTASSVEQEGRALSAIIEEAGRLADLTDTLLALADLDAGVVAIVPEPVDLEALLAALVVRHEGAASAAGLLLQIEPVESGLRVTTDRERLLQAASTLVDNAIAYTPRDGVVRLSACKQAGGIVVSVDDSGPGVPPQARDAIFERFTRLDRSRSQAGGGSGLGLAICRRLVEMQGGAVGVDASDLGGARFEITLPYDGVVSGYMP